MSKVYWQGVVKQADDFNKTIIACFIDGKTIQGPWAIMSPASHEAYGVGLGLGRGQRYEVQTDGRWLKVEG